MSPDGSRIAYVPGPKFGSELWIMDSDGANARRVAFARKPDQPNLGDGWIQHPAWSPNGTRLAYVEAHLATPDPPLFANSLLTRDANGGDLQVVLKDDSRLRPALCWAADGRILFAYHPMSEREDTGVDSISIDERKGKAAAPPQRVTEGQGWIRCFERHVGWKAACCIEGQHNASGVYHRTRSGQPPLEGPSPPDPGHKRESGHGVDR